MALFSMFFMLEFCFWMVIYTSDNWLKIFALKFQPTYREKFQNLVVIKRVIHKCVCSVIFNRENYEKHDYISYLRENSTVFNLFFFRFFVSERDSIFSL